MLDDTKNTFPIAAVGFLFNPLTREVFLHRRDDKTLYYPNKIAFFGWLAEGLEIPEEAFIRELHEEIGLLVTPEEIHSLCSYFNNERQTWRYVFYVESTFPKSAFTLWEGAGFDWYSLQDLPTELITKMTGDDLGLFQTKISSLHFPPPPP